jgi:hypothetical protein
MKQLIQPTRVAPDHGRTAAKRRLLLVDPYPRNNPYHLTASERRAVWFPKLSLPTIAAYTPDNWDVDLVDEAVEDIDFDDPCEMVGLSIMTCYAPRAYEIAAEFRKRGKTIVMGGVHPTYCPEEALQHCDAIVCGEAEDLWPELVADYEAGRMKREYRMTSFPSLENYRSPRVELLSPDAYMTRQCSFTTRGCHFDCEFCSVSPFNGKTTRRRPVQEVVREIVQVQRWVRSELIERISNEPFWQALKTTFRIRVGIDDGGIVAFVDDLHNSNRAYCRELWAALKPLKIKWGCQSTLFLGDDEEMVKLAAESGCWKKRTSPSTACRSSRRRSRCFTTTGSWSIPGSCSASTTTTNRSSSGRWSSSPRTKWSWPISTCSRRCPARRCSTATTRPAAFSIGTGPSTTASTSSFTRAA